MKGLSLAFETDEGMGKAGEGKEEGKEEYGKDRKEGWQGEALP